MCSDGQGEASVFANGHHPPNRHCLSYFPAKVRQREIDLFTHTQLRTGTLVHGS